MTIEVKYLGQSSLKISAAGQNIYTDPYFSHWVEEKEGPEFARQLPIPLQPEAVTDAHWVLISHDHWDHCDLKTLKPLAEASPQARFVGPAHIKSILLDAGIIDAQRFVPVEERWMELGPQLRLRAIPAAHPTIERRQGHLAACGFVLESQDKRLYFAGDTSPHHEILEALEQCGPIQVACLPVNEKNYFKDQRGIIGNMTLREAFEMARLMKAETVLPLHWDMFTPNSVFRQEIELVYELLTPPFALEMKEASC